MSYFFRAGWLSAIALMIVWTGCRLSSEEFDAINRWMTCDDCTDADRAAVKAIGEKAVPTLARNLKDGPDPESRTIMEQKFRANYAAFPAAGGISESEYVSELMANYVARYQKRSALSLGDINGADARKALDDASSRKGYRADVVRVIEGIRAGYTATPFTGAVSPPVVAFGDTINLTPPPGQTFSGALVLFDGRPPIFNDAVLIREADRIAISAIGASGTHLLGLQALGGASTPQVARVTIRTTSDPNDRAMRTCLDTDFTCVRLRAPSIPIAALPMTSFLSSWRTAPRMDTLDYFKFEPSTTRQVRAQLNWADSSNMDLHWRNCLSTTPVGNNDGATSGNPEVTTVTIPGGQCWLLLVKTTSAASSEPTFAQLRLTSP